MSVQTPLPETRLVAQTCTHVFSEPAELTLEDELWEFQACGCGAVLLRLPDDQDLTEIALVGDR